VTPRVELVRLPAAALRALADSDQAAAERAAGTPLSPYLAGPDCRWVWALRARQVVEDPRSAAWVTGAVRDLDSGAVVGRAGFHGPPDDAGMVEVGYAIDPQHRRHGYARAALRAMLARAAHEPGVAVVRASVSPTNEPSLALVRSEGFVVVGEQFDEVDGPELVHERPA
jgi:RimJ/RimL family protein N-acetyltransferase